MCSPHIAHVVRNRIAREGLPALSRQMKPAGKRSAAAAKSARNSATALMRAAEAGGEIIDLTHVFGSNTPTYDPGATPQHEAIITVEKDGAYIQRWTYLEHTGTHVDIPAHFVAGGTTVDHYPAELLVSRAVVIDIAAKAARIEDAMVEIADIQAWEKANGELPAGAVVLMYSGWEARWNDPDAFRNTDANGVQHYPAFSPDAAKFLIAERDIRGIGVDTLSLDVGASTTFDVHLTILGAGKYGLEGLANLAQIKDCNATVFVGVPRWEAGSGGPARILAII